MCELAVFVEALLYVILKANEFFTSVTVALTTLAVAQAKNVNVKHEGSCVNFIDDQVGYRSFSLSRSKKINQKPFSG